MFIHGHIHHKQADNAQKVLTYTFTLISYLWLKRLRWIEANKPCVVVVHGGGLGQDVEDTVVDGQIGQSVSVVVLSVLNIDIMVDVSISVQYAC